jgi:hypothetical protein
MTETRLELLSKMEIKWTITALESTTQVTHRVASVPCGPHQETSLSNPCLHRVPSSLSRVLKAQAGGEEAKGPELPLPPSTASKILLPV